MQHPSPHLHHLAALRRRVHLEVREATRYPSWFWPAAVVVLAVSALVPLGVPA